MTLTWSITQNSDIRFFFRQHPEHHVTGRLPGAVQNPRRKGFERAQRADVDHRPLQTLTMRKRLQRTGRQTEHTAHIEREVTVDLRGVRERQRRAGHVT